MEKEKFREDWLFHQKPKIEQVKKVIDKYNDSRCPILSYTCLEFRRLYAIRQNNFLNPEEFSNALNKQEWGLFHNHLNCESCSKYTVLHEYDAPIEPEFHEATQKEFEEGIDNFFEAMKPKGDIDDIITKMGFKPACGICGTQLVNGQCPNGHT
jgi:hypothetical protein